MNYLGFSPLYIILLPIVTLLGTILGAIVNGWFQGRNQRRTNSGRMDTGTTGEYLNRMDRLEANMMQRIETQARQIEKLEKDYADLTGRYYGMQAEKETLRIENLRIKDVVDELTRKLERMCQTCPYVPDDKKESIA